MNEEKQIPEEDFHTTEDKTAKSLCRCKWKSFNETYFCLNNGKKMLRWGSGWENGGKKREKSFFFILQRFFAAFSFTPTWNSIPSHESFFFLPFSWAKEKCLQQVHKSFLSPSLPHFLFVFRFLGSEVLKWIVCASKSHPPFRRVGMRKKALNKAEKGIFLRLSASGKKWDEKSCYKKKVVVKGREREEKSTE